MCSCVINCLCSNLHLINWWWQLVSFIVTSFSLLDKMLGCNALWGMLDRERNQKMKASLNDSFLQIGTALMWLMWCNRPTNATLKGLLSVRTVDYHWMLLLMSEYWSSMCPCCVSRFWEGEKRLGGQHVSWSGGWSSSNSGSVQTLTPHSSSCSGSVLLHYLCL